MASGHPFLVHTEQTTVQFDSKPTYGALLRRSCQRQYAAALRTYSIIEGGPDNGRAYRLSGCRSNAWFTRNIESGEVRVASSSCGLRWCPICSNARRNYITHSVADWIHEADQPKLITLTLKHTHAPLEHQITHLYKFFRELRRRKEFGAAVEGGVWFFQIKKSKTDGLWHPHLHMVVCGKYLPRRRLSHLWAQVTSGSVVSEIRAIHDPQKVANDVARYATCPGDLADLSPDDAITLVETLHGRRICGTWGKGRSISLRPKAMEEKGKWKSLGSWQTVMELYDTDADARAIVLSWKTGRPLPDGISCSNIEKCIDNLMDPAWADYDFESVYDNERGPP